MKHNRLLYILCSMLLFTSQFTMSMEAELADDVAESMAKDVGDNALEEAGTDAAKFQEELSKALQGGAEQLKQFMEDNPIANKDAAVFKQKLDATVSAQEATLAEDAAKKQAADQQLANEGKQAPPGGQAPDEAPPTQDEPTEGKTPEASAEQEAALTKDGLLPKDSEISDDPAVAKKQYREQYAKVAKTKNLVEKTEGALQKTVSSTRDALDEYATRMQDAERDITGVAKKYSVDLTNIPKDVLDKMGTDVDSLQEDLASGDRARIKSASKKVAKLKALSSIGDIDNIIGNFADKGASRDMADAMVSRTISDVSDQFDKLDEAMKDPDFFKETTETEGGAVEKDAKGIEHGGAGKEVKTSGLSKFLDQAEKDLGAGIKKDADMYSSECDLASTQLAKDGDIGTFESMRIRAKAYLRNPADLMSEKFDSLATDLKTTSRYDLKDKASEVVDSIGSKIKGAAEKLAGTAEMLVSAVVFMIPNIFQSTFLAQQAKAAAMASWGNPIKYGGKVYQIPDSCINLGEPTSSWPIYAQIPVSNVGDSISSEVSTLFNGAISGPTTNNALSHAIHSASSEIFSFGTTTDTTISRYNMKESKFLPLTDIVVVYGGPGAYVTPGSIAMNSSQFTGQIISLRTGLVSDATGDVVDATGLPSAKSVPLIGVTQWGGLTLPQTAPVSQGLESVDQFLPSILAKEEVAGSKVTYTQYSNVTSGSKGENISATIQDLLDTNCVTSAGSLIDSDCPCVIVDGLESLSAGLTINQAGDVATVFKVDSLTPQQFLDVSKDTAPVIKATGRSISAAGGTNSKVLGRLAPTTLGAKAPKNTALTTTPPTSSAWSGLGAVMPVFGWGTNDKYNAIFTSTAFPGFDPSTAGVVGIAKVGSISDDNMVTATAVGAGVQSEAQEVFASEDDLWVAKGCWIYLCTNTPFAQYISQGVTTPACLTGSYVDYIVFMDEDVNIVPLMVPVTVEEQFGATASYKKAQMYLNPAIKYWTSLIAYNLDDFAQEGQSIMYDLQGNVYPYSGLGALASAPAAAGSQGPTGTIPTFLVGQTNSIQSAFPEIYDQFQLHSAALIDRMNHMPIPYANCSLSPAKTFDINTTTYTPYSGLKCWESSVDGDYLIPINVYPFGSTTAVQTLPNSEAQYLLSLVTDIVYELQDNAWVPFDFTNSILNLDTNNQPIKTAAGSYEVDASNESQFYFMEGFFSGPTPPVTPPAALVNYLTQKRASWLKNMGVSAELGSGSTAITCTLAAGLSAKEAKATGSYIYQLNPSPSAALVSQQDYFVAVATSAPSLSSLKPMSILEAASQDGTLVSLLSGTLYDMTGAPLTHQNGLPKRIAVSPSALAGGKTSAEVIHDYVVKTFTQLPSEFIAAYEQSVKEYSVVQAQPQGPYPFGQHQVAIRSGDLQSGTYVYFSAGGMHKSNFKPRDLYVVLTPSGSGYALSQYDAGQTQYLLSLITGVAYDQNGQIVMTISTDDLQKEIDSWSAGWSPWVLSNLKEMQASYAAREARYAADEEKVEKELDRFSAQHDSAENKEKAAIKAIIDRLEPKGSGLPIPFPELQYDATTGQYVHPSPAGATSDSGLIYLFMGSGKVYQADGTYSTQYQPAHLKAVCDQYGVVVDAKTGKQKLGIPMMQPSLLLPEEDLDLTVGASGQSMIISTDPNFPGEPVAMPSGYGLYFSKIMDTYYAFNSSTLQWMSVDGGHVYEQDGAPVVIGNQVAIAGTNDLMLLYKDKYTQAFMSDGSEYSNLSSSNTNMQWMGLSAPYTELTVTANPKFTLYTVGKKTYRVNPAYQWHALVLVPIDENGELLSEIPDSSYRLIELVLNDKSVTNVLYHGEMYKVASVAGNVYTMRSLNVKSEASTITLTVDLVDAETNAPYITIKDGSDTFMYAYEPQSYDAAQQVANRANIWTGATGASPLPLPVGPMHDQSKVISGQTVSISIPDYVTHTLFVRDLPARAGKLVAPTAVSVKDIQGAPTIKADPTGYSTLQLGIQNVVQTRDNRFLCAIGAWTATSKAGVMTFPYVSRASYVDLATGALYDQGTGVATGQCLNMNDFLTVLDTCAVMVTNKSVTYESGSGKNKKPVTKNSKGKNILVYRSSDVSQQQAATVEADSQAPASGQGTVVVRSGR